MMSEKFSNFVTTCISEINILREFQKDIETINEEQGLELSLGIWELGIVHKTELLYGINRIKNFHSILKSNILELRAFWRELIEMEIDHPEVAQQNFDKFLSTPGALKRQNITLRPIDNPEPRTAKLLPLNIIQTQDICKKDPSINSTSNTSRTQLSVDRWDLIIEKQLEYFLKNAPLFELIDLIKQPEDVAKIMTKFNYKNCCVFFKLIHYRLPPVSTKQWLYKIIPTISHSKRSIIFEINKNRLRLISNANDLIFISNHLLFKQFSEVMNLLHTHDKLAKIMIKYLLEITYFSEEQVLFFNNIQTCWPKGAISFKEIRKFERFKILFKNDNKSPLKHQILHFCCALVKNDYSEIQHRFDNLIHSFNQIDDERPASNISFFSPSNPVTPNQFFRDFFEDSLFWKKKICLVLNKDNDLDLIEQYVTKQLNIHSNMPMVPR